MPSIRLSQPLISKVFLTGCLLASLSSLSYLGPPSSFSCNLRTYTFNLTLTLACASSSAKLYRVIALFGPATIRRKALTNVDLGRMMSYAVLVDTTILALSTLLDPEVLTMRPPPSPFEPPRPSCSTKTPLPTICLSMYKTFLLISTASLAWKAWSLPNSPSHKSSSWTLASCCAAVWGYGLYASLGFAFGTSFSGPDLGGSGGRRRSG